LQSSPEVNTTYIKELIINKLYDIGKLDDMQKSMGLDQLVDEMTPISRHFILKCICEYLKQCNKAYQKVYTERKKLEYYA